MAKRFIFWTLLIAIGINTYSVCSHAAEEYQAVISPSNNPDESDPDLVWRFRKVKVHASREGDETSPVVLIKGEFKKKNWELIWNKQTLVKPGAPSGNFIFRVPLTGEMTSVTLKANGPNSKKNIVLLINFGGYQAFRKVYPKETAGPKKRFNLFVSAGPTLIQYTEQSVPNISMTAITAKVSLGYLLFPPRWDLAFNTYITALTISQTDVNYFPDANCLSFTACPQNPTSEKVSARFLGINGRIGYALPFVKSPWKLSLMAGWYYTTMIVTDNAFGFKNMAGPQFFPVLSRSFANGSSILVYGKYSPIVGLTLSNRELAAGIGYVLPLKNGHPITFNLDYSNIYFILSNAATPTITTTVSGSSTSFSMGYGF